MRLVGTFLDFLALQLARSNQVRSFAAAITALAIASSVSAGDPEIIAGPVVIPGSTHDYYLLSPSTVEEATSVAASLGGTLVAFETFAEQIAVVEALAMWNGTPRWCWIGLSDRVTDGDWRWATGESRIFESWGTPDPSRFPGRNQAFMTPSGLWFPADGTQNNDGENLLHSIVEVGDVDCNGNFFPDDADILFGDSLDLDGNGVPDECQSTDCDGDGRPDGVEILLTPWLDCNEDGLLDACAATDAPRSDCNGNLLDDQCESPDAVGFIATYFTGADLATPIASRIADTIDFDIGIAEPWPGAGFTDFAARWTGELVAEYTGFYSFFVTSDDGIRLFVDGEILIDDWRAHSVEEVSAGVFLSAGSHVLTLEWFDNAGEAVCRLEWKPPFGSREVMPGSVMRPFLDCDDDLQLDGCQIAADPGLDCNGNGQLDVCEGTPPDCDGDGIYDWCELDGNDCNANGIPDDCEIASGAPDCQGDGIPDDCQAGVPGVIAYDDGGPEYGVRSGEGYMAWLQHVPVATSFARATAIEVDFVNTTAGRPVRIGLWRDPDGDGDPRDAELIHLIFTEVQSAEASVRDRFELPSIPLGPLGGSYFVGALMGNVTEEDFPAGLDATTPYAGASWIIGSGSPIDAAELDGPDVIEFSRLDEVGTGVWWSNWIIRFEYESPGGDCNGDGIPDQCQFAEGFLVDDDLNGIADACEDCDGDGVVDRCELTCGGDCGSIWDGLCGTEADCNGDGVPDSCQDAFTGLPDCDGNGVPDACEDPRLDCDGNGVLDACEIADGSAEDCNGDGVIDTCQLGGHPGYQVDRDYVSDLLGFTTGDSMWWAVQYEVGPDGRIIEWVDVALGDLGIGALVQIAVLADPNQDRDPSDMVPIVLGTVQSDGGNESGSGDPARLRFAFDPIDLGPVGTSFFIGVHTAYNPSADLPAAVDSTQFDGRSYLGRGSGLDDITATYSLGGLGFAAEWLIRGGRDGESPLYDCNSNRRLDACDILQGGSSDADLDGRPDECAPVCPADFDGDGLVGGADLGQFLLLWNAVNARADLNGDGRVDGEDFGAFLVSWGGCV